MSIPNSDFSVGHGQSSTWPRRALIPIVLGSGATSLVYEILWVRQLHLVFGVSQLAVCTVLATFMGGLALGGFAASRWGGRAGRPLLVYALLEMLIGTCAVAFPYVFELTIPVYLSFWRHFEPAPLVFGVFQLLLLSALLLPPTVCMGATLPLLARFVTRRHSESGFEVGILYGVNTLGAVLGTIAAGFVLLPRLGLSATTHWTAAVNGSLAMCALLLSLASERNMPRTSALAHDSEPHADWSSRLLLLVAAIAGFSALMYEVAWFRLMVLVLGGSTYAFSTMLVAFLLGIGAGGWFGGIGTAWSLRRGGRASVLRHLAFIEISVAVFSLSAVWMYNELPFVFMWLYTRAEQSPQWIWPAKLSLAIAIMSPPAVLMGAAFPYLIQSVAGRAEDVCRPVGRIYGLNTLGAIAGAILGGYLLLPLLHILGTVFLAASLNLAASLVVVLVVMRYTKHVEIGRRVLLWGSAMVVGLVAVHLLKPGWDPLLMTSGIYQLVPDMNFDERTRKQLLEFTVRSNDLILYDEGLSAVVTVGRERETGNIWLANNGKVDASSHEDLPTQVMLAHLPMLCRPDADRVMVIGLASGITAGSAALYSKPTRIDIVELEPVVIRASHEFDQYNHRPLDDPRVDLIVNDARNYLMIVEDQSYDVVISEPPNPWLTGVSNLFTRECFEVGKRKLRARGVWAQWLQTYGMPPNDLKSLLATFSDVYPYVSVFRVDIADLVLLGSDAHLDLHVSSIDDVLAEHPLVAEDLQRVGFERAEHVISLFMCDRNTLVELTGDVGRNTDDNMRIEFSAPLHLHEHTEEANAIMMEEVAEIPWDSVDGEDGLIALGQGFARHDETRRRLTEVLRVGCEKYPQSEGLLTLRRTELERNQKNTKLWR